MKRQFYAPPLDALPDEEMGDATEVTKEITPEVDSEQKERLWKIVVENWVKYQEEKKRQMAEDDNSWEVKIVSPPRCKSGKLSLKIMKSPLKLSSKGRQVLQMFYRFILFCLVSCESLYNYIT